MAGTFEIHQAGEGTFLFRLTAGDGTVVAVSPRFTTIKGVVDGITAVRENAATGFVVDLSSRGQLIPRMSTPGRRRKALKSAWFPPTDS